MESNIHIGKLVSQCIEKKALSHQKIGRSMGLPSSCIYAFERRPSMFSSNVVKLSHALRHNLFTDIAALFPADYTTAAISPLEKIIAEQAELIKKLQWENDLLKELNVRRC